MDGQTDKLVICALLALAGVLFHFMLKLSELEAQGRIITPWSYWANHPYTSIVMVMSVALTLAIQQSIGELTHFSAALTGIACNSLADKLRARGQAFADKVGDIGKKGP